jgi:hypothetical protein
MRRPQVQPGGTHELAKAVRASRLAEAKLAAAMLAAHEAGSSLRTIAIETAMSHEKVRAMIARERRRIGHVEKMIERMTTGGYGLSLDAKLRSEATARRLKRSLPVKNSDR